MKPHFRRALPPAAARAAALAWLFTAAVAPAGGAQASLLGDSIGGVLEAPAFAPGDNLWDGLGGASTASPIAAVVGAGPEFSLLVSGGSFLADLGANSLSIALINLTDQTLPIGSALLYDFTGLDLPGRIANLLLASSTFSGITFSFSDHGIHVEIPNQNIGPGTLIATFDILAGRLTGGVSVPEPGTLALFGLGCAALAAARRRRG